RLSQIYVMTERSKEAAALSVRFAILRPTGAAAQIAAARNLLSQNQLSDARHYIDRARSLRPSPSSLNPSVAAWLSLYDAQEAWLRNDPVQALARADRVADETRSMSGVRRQQSAFHLTWLYLTLGRLKQAEQAASLMPEIAWPEMRLQDWALAMILDEREDMGALRRLLDAQFQNPQSDANLRSFLLATAHLDRPHR